MFQRHAYMIMAHHRPDLIQLLIDALDDVRNDIIIHLDKKSNLNEEQFHSEQSRLFFCERINVSWGGYTQIECTIRLLKKALEVGTHSYYHFLTGSSYPLFNQDYIHEYFEKKSNYEFIGFDNNKDFSFRSKYYVPFSEKGKINGIEGRIIYFIRNISISTQKLLFINRNKKHNYTIKKGIAYFSITEDFANEVVSREKEIRRLFNKTLCCDEVFVQTIAFNSKYRNRLYNIDNEWDGSLREMAWQSNVGGEHPGMNFTMNDIDFLLKSKNLFALKFEGEDGTTVINILKKEKNI